MKDERAPVHLDAPATRQYVGVIRELSYLPVTIANIQGNHTRASDGYCAARQCGRGGYGTRHVPYPCPTRVMADSAARIAEHRASAVAVQEESAARIAAYRD